MKYFLLGCCLFYQLSYSQKYTVDARITPKEIISGHLRMGNPGPAGNEILLNNKYITIAGKPVIPVMGEVHFSRYPKDQWEDIILKMKANGINIIATYVFWIHHEEIEGQFNWTGNKDFRSFVKLCQSHGLYVYPRIGPWCHGEVRNGGTPDWIFDKKDLTDRSNHPVYQYYAERWYSKIAEQMDGLYYKDGGPIIGIQLENEYRKGTGGISHIQWLKQTARKCGMDVPMYTITGWGNISLPQDEVIPLFGDYPEQPWETNIEKSIENPAFTFEAPLNNEAIGADAAGKEGKSSIDFSRYPYLTCEIGVGNQISYHRRPIINQYDGLAIATSKIGSGSNMPGYYVFAGGSNPVGTYSTLEENQEETGYWNEYPDISYDFQAAIRETGELAPSYHQVKKLHYFLNEFGDRLAPMLPVVPKDQKPENKLQWSVRVRENSGFVFGMNYYRGIAKPIQKNTQFELTLPSGILTFPSKPVDIQDSSIFIWPFNFDMDGITLKYATAQPLCRWSGNNSADWIFIQNFGITPELCLDATQIESIETHAGTISQKGNDYIITDIKPGFAEPIMIKCKSGEVLNITILSYEEANHSWFFNERGKKYLFISNANMYIDNNILRLFGPESDIRLYASGEGDLLINNISKIADKGRFKEYSIKIPQKKVNLEVKKKEILDDANWLKNSLITVTTKNLLYHKLFTKEFDLMNTSAIRSATLYLYTEIAGKMRINKNWLNQDIIQEQLNKLDVTGYLQKGANTIIADFPFMQGDFAFAAKLVIEYFNSDKIEIVSDGSWLTTEVYTLPATWSFARNAKSPEFVKARIPDYTKIKNSPNEWVVTIPANYLDGLNNAYLNIDYTGDIGRCRLGYQLISDNFFNTTPWRIQLKSLGAQLEGKKLNFEVVPLKPGFKISFDKVIKPDEIGNAKIRDIKLIPEYSVDLNLKR